MPVPDPRLTALAAIAKPEKIIPTTVEFVDIAGLVAGASQGEGLGNKFLAHIREVDAIAHVVRCFEDPDVVHVSGRIDPAADVAIINTELALADLETVDRARQRADKAAKAMDKDAMRWRDSLEGPLAARPGRAVRAMVLDGFARALRSSRYDREAREYVASREAASAECAPGIARRLAATEASESSRSAPRSSQISDSTKADRARFSRSLLAEAGLDRSSGGYRLLGCSRSHRGPKDARLDVRAGANAPQAAGAIHTVSAGFTGRDDAYDDYIAFKGEKRRARGGRLRRGQEYLVQEGDVMHFRFNV